MRKEGYKGGPRSDGWRDAGQGGKVGKGKEIYGKLKQHRLILGE